MSINKKTIDLSRGIKIAAIYLIIVGGLSVLWPLTGLGPHHPEIQGQSFAFKLGNYVRGNLINIIFVISGICILYKQTWARKTALVFLIINAIYSANSFAWGLASGPPSPIVRLVSFLVTGFWNGLWFYLIFRVKPKELNTETGQPSVV